MKLSGSFEVGGVASPATVFSNEPEGSGVLFIHGILSSAGRYERYAESLSALGVTCVTFDLLGHGEAMARPLSEVTIADHLDQASGAYSFLEAQPDVDPKRIGVVGASYGGYLAARLLELHADIRSLLLRAPALFPDELEHVPYGSMDFDRVTAFHGRNWDAEFERELVNSAASLRNIAAFEGHVAVVQSMDDEVIPGPASRTYARVAKDQSIRAILDAKHDLTDKQKLVVERMISRWAKRNLAAEVVSPPGFEPRASP